MELQEVYSLLKADILESREEQRDFRTDTNTKLGEIAAKLDGTVERVVVLETKEASSTKLGGTMWKFVASVILLTLGVVAGVIVNG